MSISLSYKPIRTTRTDIKPKAKSFAVTDPNKRLKQGIWAYFLLLIFEGALRKWIFPALATPLLVIRDPIAIWLVIIAWKRNLLPSTFYLAGMVFIGVFNTLTTIYLGHGNVMVTFYGARMLLFHFPLIFVIGRVFNREDVIKIGKVTLLISIPMVVLIGLQFYSPQSAFINRGVGGDAKGAGFSGAMGFFRPPGTFSFTNGNGLFFALAAVFIFYFWINPKGIHRIVLIASTISLAAAIPFSISRSLFFAVAITLVFTAFAMIRQPKYLQRMLLAGIGALIILAILSKTSFFQTSTEAFLSRFENANETEGGLKGVLLDRYLGGMVGAMTQSTQPFFGYGLGMGTSVGSMLLTGDNHIYLISEYEWGRVIGESGALLGLSIILLRLGLSLEITLASYKRLKDGDLLPWMLLSFGLINLPQGQWSQPTSLGFCILISGLMIASLRTNPT